MGLKVIVVGAGIGGLATAIALRQAGHQVIVLEKYHGKTEVGFAVTVPTNASRILRHWGLDFAKARMNRFDGVDFVSAVALPYRIVSHQPQEDIYGDHSFAAHRVDFHNALRELATDSGQGTPADVREGVTVVGYDPETGSVMLQDGQVLTADVIVAADGVKSTAHKWIVGEERPATLTNISNVRFCLETETMMKNPKLAKTLLNPTYPTIYHGTRPGTVVFRYPCRNNTLQNFGCYKMADDLATETKKWREQTNQQVALDRLQGFDDNMIEIARVTPAKEMYLWKIADRDPLPAFHKGRMALVGDAGHPMQPSFGMGATFAIEDAGVLGVVLLGVHDVRQVEERLQLWEELRLSRAGAMQLFSRTAQVGRYRLSEETLDILRKVLPRDQWPPLTRPGVKHWCFSHNCLAEAKKMVERRFGKGNHVRL